MTKLTLEQILNIPQLSFYLEPFEFSFFINKNKDYNVLANLYNTDKFDAMLGVQSDINLAELDVSDSGFESITGKSDSIMTAAYGNAMKNILLKNQKMVSKDSLLLLLGGLAKKYFEEIQMKNKADTTEIVYTNGDIILERNGDIAKKTSNGPEKITVQELQESLIEGALIANKEMQEDLKRNKGIRITGTYAGRGIHSKKENLTIDAKDLDSFCKGKEVFNALNADKIKDFYNKKLYTYSDIIKAASTGAISVPKTLMLYKNGTLKKEDILKRVFKANDFETMLRKKDFSSDFKFLIYGINETGINSLERNLKNTNDRSEKRISRETFETCAQFFNDKKIGELLTHGVLDYDESKEFLDVLVKSKVITKEKSQYFEKMMEDFKCDELLNQVESEPLDGDGKGKRGTYSSGLTIDPELRLDYLKSIGSVKRVRINGEMAFGGDDEEEKKEKNDKNNGNKKKQKKRYNSLDGYELLIIPDKRIAVLEKFYEVTRDNNGHMVYKTDKNGNYIPATENATYILPIGVAKQLAEKRNKKTLMESKYVHRAFHKIGWVQDVEKKMQKINPEIQFEKQNTDLWVKRAEKSYKANKEIRSI